VHKNWAPALRRLFQLIGAAVVAGALVAAVAIPEFGAAAKATMTALNQVQPIALDTPPLPQRSTILATDGSVIGTFYYENRVNVPLSKVAPIMQEAVVAIEDQRYWTHGALDPKATLRALLHDKFSGSSGDVQGGSSLTQQYVKNVLTETAAERFALAIQQAKAAKTPAAKATAKAAETSATAEQNSAIAPDVARKVQELRYAIWVEEHNTKPQILDDYLNAVYFGGYQVYGVEAAAERYFGTTAAKLDLAQAATLAGMVNNANEYDPVAHPQATRNRRDTVLTEMVKLGEVSQAQATTIMKGPVVLHLKPAPGDCADSRYPFFCTYVQDEILNDPVFGATPQARQLLIDTGGLTIRTTLNPKAQHAAQHAMHQLASSSSSKVGMEVMVQPGTGQIEAIASSRNYGLGGNDTSIDYAADAAHGGGEGVQAGSTFKLFTLAAALSNGITEGQTFATPSQMTITGFRDCSGNDVGSWPVMNAEPADGATNNLVSATWKSVNTYYAQLERMVGLCQVAQMASALGMRNPATGGPLHQYPSFTLGADDIDIVHEAAAYAAMAVSGKYCSPIALRSIAGPTGQQLAVPSAKCHQALDPDVANEVTKILRGVLTSGTAVGNELSDREAAGKTGTTDNRANALFVGYTPNLCAEVWYGDPDLPISDPVGQFGAYTAPYWNESMEAALQGQPSPDFARPSGDYGAPAPLPPPVSTPAPNAPGQKKHHKKHPIR
jgi:membrane peptidoglycan carboxypeptidase